MQLAAHEAQPGRAELADRDPGPGDPVEQADRLELIGEIWESIEVDDVEVTQAERDLLADRLAELHNDPAAGRPWGEVER